MDGIAGKAVNGFDVASVDETLAADGAQTSVTIRNDSPHVALNNGGGAWLNTKEAHIKIILDEKRHVSEQ
ncbi:MAG: hypothetical protein AAF569_06475, partial [Pseudomonadota bacterium]